MKQIEKTLTSVEVAGMVEKDHKNLLRDLKKYSAELGELKIEPTNFFKESTYKTEQNKTMPCYLVTKNGCEFIAHKLTGLKGTAFTARYIERFHGMEDTLKKPLTAIEQLQITQQAVLEVNEKIDTVEKDLADFKKDLPLLGIECQRITTVKNRVAVRLLGGKGAPAYKDKSIRSRLYSDIQRELCRQFGINSYKEIKRCQIEKAISTVSQYEPPFSLLEDIETANFVDKINKGQV